MESRTSPSPGTLSCCVAFSQLLGLTAVAVTGAWLGLYQGGIAWESSLQFNVHPLCMVIGLVFLQGDGESSRAPHELLLREVLCDLISPEVSCP